MKKFCTPWYFAIVGGYVIENHLYTMVHFAFLPNLHVKRPFGLFVNVRCLKTISFITPRHFQTHAFLPTHFHLHPFQVWAFMLFIEEKASIHCGFSVKDHGSISEIFHCHQSDFLHFLDQIWYMNLHKNACSLICHGIWVLFEGVKHWCLSRFISTFM